MAAHATGKKNRKWDRNKLFCTKYALEGRREKNRAIKLQRFLKKHPENKDALAAFMRLPATAQKGHHTEGLTHAS